MKKNILILTDLSENAIKAAEVATVIAGPLHAALTLLNCNDTIAAITYYPIVPVMTESPTWFEERKRALSLISEHLKNSFAATFPRQPEPIITSLIGEGDLFANVKDVIEKNKIDLIVMGAQSGSSIEHFLFGSDTRSLTEHSSVPVLIVPSGAQVRPVKQITFATNFLTQDVECLQYLLEFSKRMETKLDIVHIRQYRQAATFKNAEVLAAIQASCSGKAPMVVYNEIYGKNVISSLNDHCKENNSDILALSHEHHSILFRAFKDGVVIKSLAVQNMPLLIVPELEAAPKVSTKPVRTFANAIL